ncbi:MAG TPA: hypothetical protein VGM88_20160 [Kofleriaceae bacterium]|jgi:hypothetical protein
MSLRIIFLNYDRAASYDVTIDSIHSTKAVTVYRCDHKGDVAAEALVLTAGFNRGKLTVPAGTMIGFMTPDDSTGLDFHNPNPRAIVSYMASKKDPWPPPPPPPVAYSSDDWEERYASFNRGAAAADGFALAVSVTVTTTATPDSKNDDIWYGELEDFGEWPS